MKVRVKFSKEGPVKFIGHLDTMRYFQKAVRRANLPIAYSEGFSPHMIMSFAAPLGVGVSSSGEYFDMELKEKVTSDKIVESLNEVMAEGVKVLNAVEVEEGKAGKAMSLVAACDYRITFREHHQPILDMAQAVQEYASRKEIIVTKKTKKSEKEVDIRPFIYELDWNSPTKSLSMKLASASSNYTQPSLVMDDFLTYFHENLSPYAYQVHRMEVYAQVDTLWIPLDGLGDKIV